MTLGLTIAASLLWSGLGLADPSSTSGRDSRAVDRTSDVSLWPPRETLKRFSLSATSNSEERGPLKEHLHSS